MGHLEPALQWGPWECLSEVLARWRVQGVRAAFPVEGYSGEMNTTQNAQPDSGQPAYLQSMVRILALSPGIEKG